MITHLRRQTIDPEPTVAARLGPIVLGTDGSDDAQLARRAAADIARGAGMAVHVVGAWSTPVFDSPYGGYVLAEGIAEAAEAAVTAVVDRESERVVHAGAHLAVRHTIFGRPGDAILRLADEVAAGLIVIGSRGLGPLRRVVMGSVSEDVVHHSHRPVLVVRGGPEAWPPVRILVGDDGSAGARAAVVLAAAVGRALRVPVSVATVVPHIPPSIAEIPGMSIDAAISVARARVEGRVAALSESTGLDLTAWLGVGEPASTILDESNAAPSPCLIAVGSRGLGAVERIRRGSVSTKILHGAHSSVLVVPPDERA